MVDYQEALSIKVGNFILTKGFDLASGTGLPSKSISNSSSIGLLLRDRIAWGKTYLFGLIKRRPRRPFIGVIWFENELRGATEQNLVFDVYGRNNVDLAKQLADSLTVAFGVKISVRLEEEGQQVETRQSDYNE